MHINYEFKAKAKDIEGLEKKLLEKNPRYVGEDHQIDTYFNVKKGRLKLREGNIENALIFYERPDTEGPKQSDVLLYEHAPATSLKEILTRAHGIKAVVDKKRKIYFIDNIKFHFDTVTGLGTFVEVEAIDKNGDLGIEKITEQCNRFAELFEIDLEDYIAHSYSDLVMNKTNHKRTP
jgi:predicted adenylyl cyclase CyaB